MLRFTHLLDTNDSFEVRKTFKRFAGPKFNVIMKEAAQNVINAEYIDNNIQKTLTEAGLNIPTSFVREILKNRYGAPIEDVIRSSLKDFVDIFSICFNRVKTPEEFLNEVVSILLCFSLSERYDIPAMWAHYGGNHAGLAIAFDAGHEWFKDGKNPAGSKLQKIKYIDDQKDELFDDLQAVFLSKTTDWSYKREWRINCTMKQIEKTVDLGSEKIHLRSFPPETIRSVILGFKASDNTVNRVGAVLKRKYPHAAFQRATPQRMNGIFVLEDI